MLAKIYSAAVYGVDAYEVEIEVNAGAGDPKMVIVGLPDAAVKESKDRVRTAIANSAYKWSRKRTTINLAPADIKKEGPSFDLPIALGMIAVAEGLNTSAFEKFSFVGEFASLPVRIFRRLETRMPLQSSAGATLPPAHFRSPARSNRPAHRSPGSRVPRRFE
jgi:hypothetical protein